MENDKRQSTYLLIQKVGQYLAISHLISTENGTISGYANFTCNVDALVTCQVEEILDASIVYVHKITLKYISNVFF